MTLLTFGGLGNTSNKVPFFILGKRERRPIPFIQSDIFSGRCRYLGTEGKFSILELGEERYFPPSSTECSR